VQIHRPAVSNTPLTVPCNAAGLSQGGEGSTSTTLLQMQMQMHAVRMLVRWVSWGFCHATAPGLCEKLTAYQIAERGYAMRLDVSTASPQGDVPRGLSI